MSEDVTGILRAAYDARVKDRELPTPPAWETEQRDQFLTLLEREGKRRILDVGAATGFHSMAFKIRGLDVVSADLSPEMVRRCTDKGLVAHVMDVAELRFAPEAFDAVYAMNCLVHVPKAQLAHTLAGIRRVLRSNGLFYLGLYGGRDLEGIWADDYCEPKRFFAHHTDEALQAAVVDLFTVYSYCRVEEGWRGLHFQSLVLRKTSRCNATS